MNGIKAVAGLTAAAIAAVVLVVVLGMGGGLSSRTGAELTTYVPGNTALNQAAVPEWARQPLLRAAGTCPAVTAPLLAAQIETESDWDPNAYNEESHATGLAQFVPTTWAAWGRDGDDDGTAEPRNPLDAISSQAAYLCHLVDYVGHTPGLAGELIDLALASYNAGPGNVNKYGGIPPFPETTNYVTNIRALANTKYATIPNNALGTEIQRIIQAAAAHVDRTTYAWGGGTLNGPSLGIGIDADVVGFDCSSLIRYVYYQGTNHRITLPRVAQDQYTATKNRPIAVDHLQPGDLLFWRNADRIYHVALYIGNGRMIEAPESGQKIREAAIRVDADYAGATRVIASALDTTA